MPWLLVTLAFFLSITSSNAQSRDVNSCATIQDNLQRLSCYDKIFLKNAFTPSKISDSLKISEFLADFNDLVGKDVKIEGFGIMIGENLALYETMGSMTVAFVDIKKVDRESRRQIFAKCGSGCSIAVTGNVAKVMFQPGIVATSVALN